MLEEKRGVKIMSRYLYLIDAINRHSDNVIK